MPIGIAAGVLAAVFFGIAAVAQAHAARRAPGLDRFDDFLRHAVRDPWTLGVVAAYLAGFALHAVAIWLLPLYLAQAAIALSMPVSALVARSKLHERLGVARWVAVGAVTVGLALLALGAGSAGPTHATAGFATAVWVATALLVGVGLMGRHWPGGWLGAVSGTGYAGSAIAVRGLDLPVGPAVVVAALAVPLLGLVAFWIYSTALSRSSVAAATGPLIVTQTFVPAVVGVVALGDGVRSWPLAVAGLGLATGATVALGREG